MTLVTGTEEAVWETGMGLVLRCSSHPGHLLQCWAHLQQTAQSLPAALIVSSKASHSACRPTAFPSRIWVFSGQMSMCLRKVSHMKEVTQWSQGRPIYSSMLKVFHIGRTGLHSYSTQSASCSSQVGLLPEGNPRVKYLSGLALNWVMQIPDIFGWVLTGLGIVVQNVVLHLVEDTSCSGCSDCANLSLFDDNINNSLAACSGAHTPQVQNPCVTVNTSCMTQWKSYGCY